MNYEEDEKEEDQLYLSILVTQNWIQTEKAGQDFLRLFSVKESLMSIFLIYIKHF